jgi:hypothetical protein
MFPDVIKWMVRVCPLPREVVRVTLAMGKYVIDEMLEADRPEFAEDQGQSKSLMATPYTKIDRRVMDNLGSMYEVGDEKEGNK